MANTDIMHRYLKEYGYTFYREGGNHTLYKCEETGHVIALSRGKLGDSDLKRNIREIVNGGKKREV